MKRWGGSFFGKSRKIEAPVPVAAPGFTIWGLSPSAEGATIEAPRPIYAEGVEGMWKGFPLPYSVTVDDLERPINRPNWSVISPNSIAFVTDCAKVLSAANCRPKNPVFSDMSIVYGDIGRGSPPARGLK